jgi:hypothetical protein
MARIRTIKPEFWGDEKLAPLCPLTRLTFLGLISQADDAGRLLDSEKRIDGLLFPMTGDSCAKSLVELSLSGRIQRGTTDSGQRIIQIANWKAHQKIDKPNLRASLPKIVTFDDLSATSRRQVGDLFDDPSALHTNDLRSTTNDQRPTTVVPLSRKQPRDDSKRETWLTAPSLAWDAINGAGSFPFGKAAKALAPLHKAGVAPEKIAAHLTFYLEMYGDIKGHLKAPEDRGWGGFKPNLAHFAETFEQWNPEAPFP